MINKMHQNKRCENVCLHMHSLSITAFTSVRHQLLNIVIRLLEWSNQGEWDGLGMQHARDMRNAYTILVGKLEEKRPLERSRRRWEITSEWI